MAAVKWQINIQNATWLELKLYLPMSHDYEFPSAYCSVSFAQYMFVELDETLLIAL